MLVIAGLEFRVSHPGWGLQEVLLTFCQAIVTTNFPYKTAFQKPGTSWVHNGKVAWQLDTTTFPGPKLRPKAEGNNHYRWFHGTTRSTLLGIFKSGRMLRTRSETVGCKSADTAHGFLAGPAGRATTVPWPN